jgi:hypothetical protein
MMMAVMLYVAVFVQGYGEEKYYFGGTSFVNYHNCERFYQEYQDDIVPGIINFATEEFGTEELSITEIGCVTRQVDYKGNATMTNERPIIKK